MRPQKRSVLGSLINTLSYRDFLDEIFRLVDDKVPSYICFANVHMVVEGHRQRSFQKIINEATLVAPDGKPLSLFLRLTGGSKQERVCGMDILPDILARAEAYGKSVYFYGTTPALLNSIEEKARKEFPALKIAGHFSPPFRNLTAAENTAITNEIRSTNPDLVLVSLGCPKQEKWMAENQNRIGACLLGLGQAFRVYAGEEKRLPRWMRDLSLEWSYRLYLEPRRLWKRYLVTNSLFILLAAKELLELWAKVTYPPERNEIPPFRANEF